MSLKKIKPILYPSRGKWQMMRIAPNHHRYSIILDERGKHSYMIYLDYLKILCAYAGLLVDAMMIALFACRRLEQNGNEGAMPTTTNHGRKAWSSLITVGSSTTNRILLKLGVLESLTWLATLIVPLRLPAILGLGPEPFVLVHTCTFPVIIQSLDFLHAHADHPFHKSPPCYTYELVLILM